MNECKMVEFRTFYQPTEQIVIDAPVAGIVFSNHPSITIVPRIVAPGENTVVAIRNTRLVTVNAGEVVGIILPLSDEGEEEAELVGIEPAIISGQVNQEGTEPGVTAELSGQAPASERKKNSRKNTAS